MSALKGLMVAVEVAERQRDAARQGVQNARAAHQAAQGATVAPEVMFHHYQFMARLAHAIGLQTTVVRDYEGRVAAAQQGLLQTELRLASLKKLTDKRRLELEHAQARRDQKQTDERAALQYRKTSNGL